MTAHNLTCQCGHRLALHTYFKDTNPCTRCGCRTFDEEGSGRFARRRAASEDSATALDSTSKPAADPKRHLL
jgi:hypothetical protein